jgi:hypothetical protein
LLKVMVMLDDAPQFFLSLLTLLTPHHAELYTRGRQHRAQLPSYLEQQLAIIIEHCPVPTVLQSLVAEYAATTPEDMWTDGLRIQAPQPKRPRAAMVADGEDKEDGKLPFGDPFACARSVGDGDIYLMACVRMQCNDLVMIKAATPLWLCDW